MVGFGEGVVQFTGFRNDGSYRSFEWRWKITQIEGSLVKAEKERGCDEMSQAKNGEREARRAGGLVGGGAKDGVPHLVMCERRIWEQIETSDPLWIGRDVCGRGHKEFVVECGGFFIAGNG